MRNRLARVLTAAVMLIVSGCAGISADRSERPLWITEPKTSDLMYFYAIGHADGQATEDEGLQAAFADAVKKLKQKVAGRLSVDVPVNSISLNNTEMVPGCQYDETSRRGHEIWVQVSWPVRDLARLERSLTSTSKTDSIGTTSTDTKNTDSTTSSTGTPDNNGIGSQSGFNPTTPTYGENEGAPGETVTKSPCVTQSGYGITVEAPEELGIAAEEIRISRPVASKNFCPDDTFFFTLATMDITVSRTNVFNKEIVIRVAYSPANLNPNLTPTEQIRGARWDDGLHQWIEMPIEVDEKNMVIITRTRHLCTTKWITDGIGSVLTRGGRYVKKAGNTFIWLHGLVPNTANDWVFLNRVRMSASFRFIYDSGDLSKSKDVGDVAWAKKPNVKAIRNQRGIPLFVWDLSSALDAAMEVYTNSLGLTPPATPIEVMIDSSVIKGYPGHPPGAFEPDTDRIHFNSSIQNSWNSSNIKFRAAHELFHAFQHLVVAQGLLDLPYAQVAEGPYLWWVEACADYAASVASGIKTLMGHGNIYSKLLDYPLPFTGVPPVPNYGELEYDKAWFIDYLVNQKGVSFKDLHLAVAGQTTLAAAPSDNDSDPIFGNLHRFLKEKTQSDLAKVYRDFAGYFLFSRDSTLNITAPQKDSVEIFEPFPLPAAEGVAVTPIEHAFSVPAPYAIRVWAVKPEAEKGENKKNRTMSVQLKKIAPSMAVDVYVQSLNEDQLSSGAAEDDCPLDKKPGQPAPTASLANENDATVVTVGPNDIIFVVVANTGFTDPSQATVVISEDKEVKLSVTPATATVKVDATCELKAVVKDKAALPKDAVLRWRIDQGKQVDQEGELFRKSFSAEGTHAISVEVFNPATQGIRATASATVKVEKGDTPPSSNVTALTQWKFTWVKPDNWVVSYKKTFFDRKVLVMKRNPATNKVAAVNANLSAYYPTTASGKDDPKTAGDCLAAAEKAFKSRRQGKTLNDPGAGLSMVGGVEGAKSCSIGDFQGAMVDYALWMRRGSGSGSTGYTGSGFGCNGDGSAVKENMLIGFDYSVTGGGSWDNSDQAYLVSEGVAAQEEARAIIASLRVVPDGDIKQEP